MIMLIDEHDQNFNYLLTSRMLHAASAGAIATTPLAAWCEASRSRFGPSVALRQSAISVHPYGPHTCMILEGRKWPGGTLACRCLRRGRRDAGIKTRVKCRRGCLLSALPPTLCLYKDLMDETDDITLDKFKAANRRRG